MIGILIARDISSSSRKSAQSAVYDRLDPKLCEAAWPVVMERLAYADLHTAAAWFEKHGNDPGYDERATDGFISRMAGKDPAGTAKWASCLTVSTDGVKLHHPPH